MTAVDIYNMALSRLGTRATVATVVEASVEAEQCTIWYATVRDGLLRARDWNFARITAELDVASENPPARWSHAYELPADCLRLLRLDPAVPFEIGSDGAARFIWTDRSEAVAVYTQQVTDTTRMDPLFIAAFAAALAAAIALPITQKPDVARAMALAAREALDAAGVADGNEAVPRGYADYDADYIAVRS